MKALNQILEAIGRGEENSATRLLPLVYNELRRVAGAKLKSEAGYQTLQPTALVHEAWLRLTGPHQSDWQNRGHFYAAAAEAMRRILIDRARRRARLRHGGGMARMDLTELELPGPVPEDRLLQLDEALDRLQAEDPERARLVMLKFYAGLSNAEVAETLGVTERTVERQWTFAKAWLFRAIRQME